MEITLVSHNLKKFTIQIKKRKSNLFCFNSSIENNGGWEGGGVTPLDIVIFMYSQRCRSRGKGGGAISPQFLTDQLTLF